MTFKTIFGRTAFLAATLALFLTAASEAKAACSDTYGPGVDWSNCDKSDVYLNDVYLNDANLYGADLSYADLSGANLEGANLYGAWLSGAVWTDGRVCAEGSLGACY
jgi:uncharacterized protein YjbI with pentapeptide repeats